ncbi:hypothetical protein [Sphingomonas dokdonensis]|uniref:Uncharacterized protein n=1 Tax=Sphingomonas dokdonensis TaxID=344880 RepID=A0A245ZL56_9SPHN|nr:hypothetical protein [Sphingomonas dokdonensis]OWK30476.1 hypothetical protein SPDO_21630 [Sphingomonas dokdonensis]
MTAAIAAAPHWVRWWFRGAAVYGLLALLPQYLLPQPANAELVAYGFIGTASAFQLVFWVIGGDPVRYRALMLTGVAEKLAFGVPALLLFAGGKAPSAVLLFAGIDLALALGFLLAWRATPVAAATTQA